MSTTLQLWQGPSGPLVPSSGERPCPPRPGLSSTATGQRTKPKPDPRHRSVPFKHFASRKRAPRALLEGRVGVGAIDRHVLGIYPSF
eukprot:scaffold24_cov341-Pavlova_lutheri.AAC.80